MLRNKEHGWHDELLGGFFNCRAIYRGVHRVREPMGAAEAPRDLQQQKPLPHLKGKGVLTAGAFQQGPWAGAVAVEECCHCHNCASQEEVKERNSVTLLSFRPPRFCWRGPLAKPNRSQSAGEPRWRTRQGTASWGAEKSRGWLSVDLGADGTYPPETPNHDLAVLCADWQVLAAIYMFDCLFI